MFIVLIPPQSVEAATLSFPIGCNGTSFTPGDGQVGLPFQITYDDSSNPTYTTNGLFDTITITIKSSTNPTGIPLVLNETGPNTGIFQNSNLALTEYGDNLISLEKGVTITVGEAGGADPLNIVVVSDSDPAGIVVPLHLSGANATTQFFSGKIFFTRGPTSGNHVHAGLGDMITITDPVGYATSGLIIPNSKPTVGALQVNFKDSVTISGNGLICTGTVDDEFGIPGGGGGGLIIRPSLVLDLLAAIGGSPHIVSPPSFGGSYYHYSDGLTFTEGDTKTTFDTSKYNQDLQRQVMVAGTPVNMTFKTFEAYNPTGVIHMGLYIIPRGQDMLTSNSIGSIIWEKGQPVEVNDPNHILSNATTSSTDDGKFQYTQFTFVPTKSYDKMSFLARAWNDHMYSTDVRVHDEVDPSPMQYNQPDWLHVYNNLHDADYAVEGAGFVKPNIFSHVSTSEQVWLQTDRGTVLWFYDEKDQAVAVEAFDSNRNVVWVQSELLHKIIPSPTQGPDASYSGNHLNRWDKIALENAQKAEEDRVKTTLQRMGYPVYWDHTITR